MSRVGKRGQITIAKAIRDELGMSAGDLTIQRIEGGTIVIVLIPRRHRRSLAGTLADKVRRRPHDESWPALRNATWR